MKFIVSSGVLSKKLQSVSGIVGPSATMPIIENFKFDISTDILMVTTTDGETTLNVEMPVQCKEEASICIESKLLSNYLKNLSEQPLTFDINTKDFSVEITSDEGKYKLMGENPIIWPKSPEDKGSKSFTMPAARILEGINNTLFAVATDEMRKAMTGVFFEMNESSITFVATDAHRLMRYLIASIKCPSSEGIIVPKKPLAQLKTLLPNDDSEVKLSFGNGNLYIKHNDFNLTCRLIEGKYPDYKVVIPTQNPFLLTINREEFLGALRRVNVFANKTTNQVVLKITSSELRMKAQDVDFAHEGNEGMTCNYTGDDLDIAFNAKLLLELLSAFTSEELLIELSTSSRAGIIRPSTKPDDVDVIGLVMPLMIGN
jgi:DNA polymerase III subunit beta